MIGNEQESLRNESEEAIQETEVQEMESEEALEAEQQQGSNQEKGKLEDNIQAHGELKKDGLDKEVQESSSAELVEVAKGQDADLLLICQDEKMQQFQKIMNYIIGHALEANNEKLSQEISSQVNDRLSGELEELMRIRDERDEERFRQLDEIIRSYQRDSQGKAEAAAARIPFFKRKRFRKRRHPQNA